MWSPSFSEPMHRPFSRRPASVSLLLDTHILKSQYRRWPGGFCHLSENKYQSQLGMLILLYFRIWTGGQGPCAGRHIIVGHIPQHPGCNLHRHKSESMHHVLDEEQAQGKWLGDFSGVVLHGCFGFTTY